MADRDDYLTIIMTGNYHYGVVYQPPSIEYCLAQSAKYIAGLSMALAAKEKH